MGKAIGKITIVPGLILNNPTLEIINIIHTVADNSISVQCYFKEEGSELTHSRTFKFKNQIGINPRLSEILIIVNAHSVLKLFS